MSKSFPLFFLLLSLLNFTALAQEYTLEQALADLENAIDQRNAEQVKNILDRTIDSPDGSNVTYNKLQTYIVYGDFSSLTSYGKDFNPLYQAIGERALDDIIFMLSAGLPAYYIIDAPGGGAYTLLGELINNKDAELVRILLESGVEINAWGSPDLTLAVGSTKEILTMLLEYGADPNEYHETQGHGEYDLRITGPLVKAVEFNKLEMAQILLENGASANSYTVRAPLTPFSITQNTVLDLAYANSNDDMIQLLLEYGAMRLEDMTADQLQLVHTYHSSYTGGNGVLRIRTAPDSSSSLAGILAEGESVEIIKCQLNEKSVSIEEPCWFYILSEKGKTGWVYGEISIWSYNY